MTTKTKTAKRITKNKYVKITRKEFEKKISDYCMACENPNSTSAEYVYYLMWGRENEWKLEVYSSVTPLGSARPRGTDAIRVILKVALPEKKRVTRNIPKNPNRFLSLTDTRVDRIIVWSATRVNRVPGWDKRLFKRIEEALYRGMDGAERPYCPSCGSALIVRDTKPRGDNPVKQFVGCSAWRKDGGCTYTRSVR